MASRSHRVASAACGSFLPATKPNRNSAVGRGFNVMAARGTVGDQDMEDHCRCRSIGVAAGFVAALAGMLVAASASAAWTPYFNVVNADRGNFAPKVAIAPDGTSVFLWGSSSGANPGVKIRTRAPDGTKSPIQTIGPSAALTGDSWDLAVDSDGNAFFVWLDVRNEYKIRARERLANGTLGPVQTLAMADAPASELGHVHVGTDGAGRAVFSWARLRADGSRVVQARSRSAAGILSPTVNVGSASEPQMAVAPDGRTFFTWRARTGAVLSRVLGRGGDLGSIRTISASGFDPQVATDGQSAVYLWVDPGDDQSQARVMTRERLPGGSLASPQVVAEGGTLLLSTEGNLAMASDGTASFCWIVAGTGAQGRIRSPSGTLGPTENLGGTGCQVGIDSSGDVVFAESVNFGGKRRIFARTQPAGGSLGPLHVLSPPGYNGYLGGVAVNDTGDAAVVWQEGNRGFAIQGAAGP